LAEREPQSFLADNLIQTLKVLKRTDVHHMSHEQVSVAPSAPFDMRNKDHQLSFTAAVPLVGTV
jgi:hypothetical protein